MKIKAHEDWSRCRKRLRLAVFLTGSLCLVAAFQGGFAITEA